MRPQFRGYLFYKDAKIFPMNTLIGANWQVCWEESYPLEEWRVFWAIRDPDNHNPGPYNHDGGHTLQPGEVFDFFIPVIGDGTFKYFTEPGRWKFMCTLDGKINNVWEELDYVELYVNALYFCHANLVYCNADPDTVKINESTELKFKVYNDGQLSSIIDYRFWVDINNNQDYEQDSEPLLWSEYSSPVPINNYYSDSKSIIILENYIKNNTVPVMGQIWVYNSDPAYDPFTRPFEILVQVPIGVEGTVPPPPSPPPPGNQQPSAFIDSISPQPANYGETVTFAGHGTDIDGVITDYSWRSSINGQLSAAANFSTSSLSIGSHIIYFKVKDNQNTWSNEVFSNLNIIQSQNQKPEAFIDSINPSPANYGEPVTFKGHGVDQDGDIIAYEWSSNLDGALSTIASFTTTSLSPGIHIISFRVRDNEGVWSNKVTQPLYINAQQNQKPIAYIDSINPAVVYLGDSVTFNGHGIDTDGTITAYNWRSSLSGQLSTEKTFSTTSLTVGKHNIFFKVMDNDYTWSDEIMGTVEVLTKQGQPEPPMQSINIPTWVIYLIIGIIILLVILRAIGKKEKS